MTKTVTTAFGSTVLGATYLGAIANSSALSFVLDTSQKATLIRASLAVFICIYCFAGTMRRRLSRQLLLVVGFGLLYFGVAGLLTSHLSDTYNYYILPVDIFFAIEGGVIALLLGLELPLATQKPITTMYTVRPTGKKTPAFSSKTA